MHSGQLARWGLAVAAVDHKHVFRKPIEETYVFQWEWAT